MTEDDTLWKENTRETIHELKERIHEFFNNTLVNRPENNIVIVTHGVWIETCLYTYCPQVLDYGKQRVYNCDMYIMDCVSSSTPPSSSPATNNNNESSRFVRLDNIYQIK
jgi:broad specificity phosphatase PhoE